MKPILETVDPDVFTIRGIFSPELCRELVTQAEGIGFQAASVRTSKGAKMLPKIRNNSRVDLSDPELAERMWDRVSDLLPELDGQVPICVDTNLRFYRYLPGQEFRRHRDGSVVNERGQVSKLSYLIYLNDEFEGGSTTFRDYEGLGSSRRKIESVVSPEIGLGLLFRHERWHEGSAVSSGQKYVLRTDVFYDVPN